MKRLGVSTLFVFAILFSANPARAESGYFDSVGGVKIFYTVEGAGDPVLLIHGFRFAQGMNWKIPGTIRLLAKKYKVISIDNRGHGASDKPTTRDAYGPTMVEDAIGLLDHLNIESAHVVGYSMGGMITLKMLAKYPERIRSAVIGGMGWTQPTPEAERRYRVDPDNTLNPALVACWQSFYDLDLTEEQLAAIETPFMIVVGSEDGLLHSRVEPLSKIRPDVPVLIVEGAKHNNCVFRPEFREGILSYIDSHTGHE